MIPAHCDYVAPDSLEEAIRALGEGGEGATLLAGGHSLVPLMKLRLAAPTLLVDLRNVPGLSGVERDERSGGERPARDRGAFRIGAMVRHAEVARRLELGLAARAAGTIADPQVRNRGTIGGTLAHGDPASDMPAVMLACEATVTARGPDGQRRIAVADLFQGRLTTALQPAEVLTGIQLPAMDGYGFAYRKANRRREDWATVAVSALVSRAEDGTCSDVRIGLANMGPRPMRASAAERALRGRPLDAEWIAHAADRAAEGTNPLGDHKASSDYKRHLSRVLCRRALEEAVRPITTPASNRTPLRNSTGQQSAKEQI